MSVTVRWANGTEEVFRDWTSTDGSVIHDHSFAIMDDGSLAVSRTRSELFVPFPEEEIGRFRSGQWTSVRSELWGEGSSVHVGWYDLEIPFPRRQMVVRVGLPDAREDGFRDGVTVYAYKDGPASQFYRHSYEIRPDESLVVVRETSEFDELDIDKTVVGHYAADGWISVRTDAVTQAPF